MIYLLRVFLLVILVFSYGVLQLILPFLKWQINQLGCRLLLTILNIKIQINGIPVMGHHIAVANHISWLDPIALVAQQRLSFITSKEVQKDWFLGTICQTAGCSFVSRNPWTVNTELEQLKNRVLQGESLAFFPEATSTNGLHMHEFKTPLFELAMQLRIPVQPISLVWSDATTYAYFGDMTFWQSIHRVFKKRHGIIYVHYLETIVPESVDFSSRKTLAKASENQIRTNQSLISVPSGNIFNGLASIP